MNAYNGLLKTSYDRLFIDGQWLVPTDGQDPVISPSTEEVVGSAPLGGTADTELAIAAARRSFDAAVWRDEERKVRVARMERLFELVKARREEAIGLMQLEMGFTRLNAEMQLDLLNGQLEHALEASRRNPVRSLPMIVSNRPAGGRSLGGAVVTRDPIGVVSAITPYNSGFLLGLLKSFPAMAAGNSVVLKPSPFTPLQTMLIAEIVAEADLPRGVFNIVTGGLEVGQLMSSDPRIDMVSFTGSDAVGAAVMAQAAPTLKKVQLELGGKSPADVAAELAGIAAEAFEPGRSTRDGETFTHRLTSRRVREVHNSTGRSIPAIRARMPFNPAYIHPDELAALGLQSGDRVTITSDTASIPAIVESDLTVRRGVVSMSHGFGGAPGSTDYEREGSSTGALISTDRDLDPINAMPRMSAIPIRITPLAAPAG